MANFGLSTAKRRRLQAAASAAGIFKILAVDHRRVLIKLMGQNGSGDVSSQRVTDMKLDILRTVGPFATAVILDPQYSARQAVACSAVPNGVGLLTAIDLEWFEENRPVSASGGWDVREARKIGATGVKLFLAYHPGAGVLTATQENLVRNAVM